MIIRSQKTSPFPVQVRSVDGRPNRLVVLQAWSRSSSGPASDTGRAALGSFCLYEAGRRPFSPPDQDPAADRFLLPRFLLPGRSPSAGGRGLGFSRRAFPRLGRRMTRGRGGRFWGVRCYDNGSFTFPHRASLAGSEGFNSHEACPPWGRMVFADRRVADVAFLRCGQETTHPGPHAADRTGRFMRREPPPSAQATRAA